MCLSLKCDLFLQWSAMQTVAKYLLHLNWITLSINLLYLTLKHIGFKVALDQTGTSPPPILHIWAHLPSVWEVVRCPLTWVRFPRKYRQFKAKIFVGIFQEYLPSPTHSLQLFFLRSCSRLLADDIVKCCSFWDLLLKFLLMNRCCF